MIKKVTDENALGKKSVAQCMFSAAKDLIVRKPGPKSHTKSAKHSPKPIKKLVVIVGIPAGEKLKMLAHRAALNTEELVGSTSDCTGADPSGCHGSGPV